MRLTSRLWGILALVGTVAVGLLVWQTRPLPPRRTSLVLITVDTLRADHLGAYGYEPARTPHIDALAARGLRFTQAVTPVPFHEWTLDARTRQGFQAHVTEVARFLERLPPEPDSIVVYVDRKRWWIREE